MEIQRNINENKKDGQFKKRVRPEVVFSVKPVKASVFSNEVKTATGMVAMKSVSLQRSYMDKYGTFQSTNSLRVDDIPKAILVLRKAFEHMALEERHGDVHEGDIQPQ